MAKVRVWYTRNGKPFDVEVDEEKLDKAKATIEAAGGRVARIQAPDKPAPSPRGSLGGRVGKLAERTVAASPLEPLREGDYGKAAREAATAALVPWPVRAAGGWLAKKTDSPRAYEALTGEQMPAEDPSAPGLVQRLRDKWNAGQAVADDAGALGFGEPGARAAREGPDSALPGFAPGSIAESRQRQRRADRLKEGAGAVAESFVEAPLSGAATLMNPGMAAEDPVKAEMDLLATVPGPGTQIAGKMLGRTARIGERWGRGALQHGQKLNADAKLEAAQNLLKMEGGDVAMARRDNPLSPMLDEAVARRKNLAGVLGAAEGQAEGALGRAEAAKGAIADQQRRIQQMNAQGIREYREHPLYPVKHEAIGRVDRAQAQADDALMAGRLPQEDVTEIVHPDASMLREGTRLKPRPGGSMSTPRPMPDPSSPEGRRLWPTAGDEGAAEMSIATPRERGRRPAAQVAQATPERSQAVRQAQQSVDEAQAEVDALGRMIARDIPVNREKFQAGLDLKEMRGGRAREELAARGIVGGPKEALEAAERAEKALDRMISGDPRVIAAEARLKAAKEELAIAESGSARASNELGREAVRIRNAPGGLLSGAAGAALGSVLLPGNVLGSGIMGWRLGRLGGAVTDSQRTATAIGNKLMAVSRRNQNIANALKQMSGDGLIPATAQGMAAMSPAAADAFLKRYEEMVATDPSFRAALEHEGLGR